MTSIVTQLLFSFYYFHSASSWLLCLFSRARLGRGRHKSVLGRSVMVSKYHPPCPGSFKARHYFIIFSLVLGSIIEFAFISKDNSADQASLKPRKCFINNLRSRLSDMFVGRIDKLVFSLSSSKRLSTFIYSAIAD